MKKTQQKFRLLLALIFSLQSLAVFSQSNQYLHFDGVNDHVMLQNGSQYLSGSSQISMTGWFYCDQLAYGQGYFGFRIGSGNAEFYIIQLNNGVLECRLKTTTGLWEYVSPANTAIPQIWQHIAWIYDGSSVKLYVNGLLKGSATASGVFQGTEVPFAIGRSVLSSLDFYFGGRIDEVTAWNRALTQQEIQDMIENELTGNENGLQLYYKFNQGEPGGDNTAITHLICEIGNGERNGELLNFALTGETSNFNGTLDPGYQAISFPQVPNHLNIDPPFEIEATATSGLEVIFEVLAGPATIEGNLVTLTGEPGTVSIQATQPGNSQFDPAVPVVNHFQVIDPYTHVPIIDVRHPLPGTVHASTLSEIRLSAISTIEYPELFNVDGVHFIAGGQTIPASDPYDNGHYTAWWIPSSYGNHTITIVAENNFGASTSQNININIAEPTNDVEVIAAEDVWLHTAIASVVVESELPSFLGSFDQITAHLEVSCPSGGCGEWDRLASIDVKGHDGIWFELIRYITPYGVPCSHSIDLTDYASLLHGKVNFRFNCVTFDNGFEYKLSFNYRKGNPTYLYSTVYEVWKDNYQFGDYANLQPVEDWEFQFPDNALASTLKIVSTGHGWGNLNTGNAAEFYNATHHIWVNGSQTFTQANWNVCNPNPDGCQPQNGTWYHNRAGWCPGAIAPWFTFNMTPFISAGSVNLEYVFFENYVDYCHPNHPDCVTGVTCPNCDDGFNPNLEVACNLVVFSDDFFVGTKNPEPVSRLNVKPNPSSGLFELTVSNANQMQTSTIRILNMTGLLLQQSEWNGKAMQLDLSDYPKGMYLLMVQTPEKNEVLKLIVQ
jgi:hypothetical protein